MKVYKLSFWYYIFLLLLDICIFFVSTLYDNHCMKLYGYILIGSLILLGINGMLINYSVSDSKIVACSKIWGEIEISFFDIKYIVKALPNSKSLFFIRIISEDRTIAIFPWLKGFKDLLIHVLSNAKLNNPDVSIDIQVIKMVDLSKNT